MRLASVVVLLALVAPAGATECLLPAPWGATTLPELQAQENPGAIDGKVDDESDCVYKIALDGTHKGNAVRFTVGTLDGLGGEEHCCSSYVEVLAGRKFSSAASLGVFCADMAADHATVLTPNNVSAVFLHFVTAKRAPAHVQVDWVYEQKAGAPRGNKCNSQSDAGQCKQEGGCRWCGSKESCLPADVLCSGSSCTEEQDKINNQTEAAANNSMGNSTKPSSLDIKTGNPVADASEELGKAQFNVTDLERRLAEINEQVQNASGTDAASEYVAELGAKRDQLEAQLSEARVTVEKMTANAKKVRITTALSKLAGVDNSSKASKDAAKDPTPADMNMPVGNFADPGRDEKQNTSLVDGDEEESEVVEEDEGLRGAPGLLSPKSITSALGMRPQPNLDSNQTTDIDLMPEDPNLNDTTASMSYRGRKLRDYLASNDAVMVRLAEEVENADTVEQMDAVRKAAKRIIFGVLNRVNDLLSICVADDAPMTLPFGEYASVMNHTLSTMLNVVKAAKRNDIKL